MNAKKETFFGFSGEKSWPSLAVGTNRFQIVGSELYDPVAKCYNP